MCQKREPLGTCIGPRSQQSREICYGTKPCTCMVQILPPSQSSGGTHRRFFPPDRMGEMKSSGQTTSIIHLYESSGRRILPMPDSTRMTPRLYTTLAVHKSLGSLLKTSRSRLMGAHLFTTFRMRAPTVRDAESPRYAAKLVAPRVSRLVAIAIIFATSFWIGAGSDLNDQRLATSQ